MPADPHTRLTNALSAGVSALRDGRPGEAAVLFVNVAEDPHFAVAPDLVDIRARVFSLAAQSLLEAGDPTGADRWCRASLRALRQSVPPNPKGLQQVRSLAEQIGKDRAAQQQRADNLIQAQRLAAQPVGRLVRELGEPDQRARALAQKAAAELQVGRAEHAAELAELAARLADEHNVIDVFVLASITRASADPKQSQTLLTNAWRRAGDADEFNLVSTVKRAADSLGVALPVQVGPDIVRRRR